jgi:hypothetical protein
VVEGPVYRHGPFIAAVIEGHFLFEDCVADSGLDVLYQLIFLDGMPCTDPF